jgi:hypothetical protein
MPGPMCKRAKVFAYGHATPGRCVKIAECVRSSAPLEVHGIGIDDADVAVVSLRLRPPSQGEIES